MKIGGVEVKGPCEEVLVLPRLDGDIVIKARAVMDMSMFDKLCPLPDAPGIRTKEGFKPNTKDPSYMALCAINAAQKMAFLVISSLEPSNIEWARVKLDDPTTWQEWTAELKEAGISDIECNRIVGCVMQANSLDEEKLRAARDVFLRGQAV
jgi:hypothetical protein